MTKHGCFSFAVNEVENRVGNVSSQKRFGLLINAAIAALMIFIGSGCAHKSNGSSRAEQRWSKEELLQRKLRRAQAKIETLRERNLILKSRIKMISRSGGAEALYSKEDLNGFDNGVVLDVPIDSRREPTRESTREPSAVQAREVAAGREEVLNRVDLRPKVRTAERLRKLTARPQRLPAKQAPKKVELNSVSTDSLQGEQADRALVRTIVALLKEKDFSEAERTAALLEKSYPDSSALPEAKFQIGLAYFRSRAKVKGALQKADGFFAESLGHSTGHVRVKAGASLMRGIIAMRIGQPLGDRRNLEIATRNFNYVISTFPKTSEARRARAELSAINRSVK